MYYFVPDLFARGKAVLDGKMGAPVDNGNCRSKRARPHQLGANLKSLLRNGSA
jgi:hypothetical protein